MKFYNYCDKNVTIIVNVNKIIMLLATNVISFHKEKTEEYVVTIFASRLSHSADTLEF